MTLPPGASGALPVPEGYRIGAWRVDRLLGNGAFGSVYAARRALPRLGLPSRAALKFLPTGTRTPRQLRHLRELADRETEVLSRVRAPRLIRLYEILAVDAPDLPELDGATVLVLEEADCSLDALLAEDRTPRAGPALLAQICEGLAQLHRAGWVHGDLKPGNVLLMPDGTARLADFNLAAELDGTHAYAPPFATPDYTPPDLLWAEIGERGRQIRPTADIWAFGILAHLVLTGALPLPGATPAARRDAAVRYARGEEELRISPRLPLLWRDIVHDCLARRPEDRALHSTASLLARVRTAAAGRRPRRPLLPVLRRHRRPLIAAAATGLLAGVLGLGVGGDPTAYGRCEHGQVCFFSETDGHGEVCAWVDGYADWTVGGLACEWSAGRPPRSVYNNGQTYEEGAGLVDVLYYTDPGRQWLLGCVQVGERRNLAEGERPRSHTWVPDCTATPGPALGSTRYRAGAS
ncbi:serine/threonine-protein kinase [Kitasatospora sp. NPDC008115]|uniref:serine/threonine-protein kinase n=1 Tax=Kitasatospora sp. NPDC008115 TaxID=3364022 RepID=UPI0036EA2E5D